MFCCLIFNSTLISFRETCLISHDMTSSSEKYTKRGVRTSYVSTVLGISLVLFMIGLVLGGVMGLKNVEKQAKESLQGDLFFKPQLNAADIKQIEQELKTWGQFNEVFFVSPDRAVEEFSGNGNDAKQILSVFEGENPLPPTIGFKPKAAYATKQGMANIKRALLKAYPDQLDEVNYDHSSVETVNLGFGQFVFLFIVVALILIVIAVAMINNTIRLALYSKRFTIKTMQLVGATSGYIRRPFLRQAIWQGLISSLIGLALLMTLFFALNNTLESLEISFTLEGLIILIGVVLSTGVLLTVLSTWIALSKYLRMKLDDLY
jgi:cell division transport system permease protein